MSICGTEEVIVGALFDTSFEEIIFSPSDFNWSTKESTSLERLPSFIARLPAVVFMVDRDSYEKKK